MEHLNRFVSSRGILKSCHAHNARPRSSTAEIDGDLLDHLPPFGSVYVCTDALSLFARSVLPEIRHPFTLVSGDSDLSITPALLASHPVSAIVQSPLLRGWFAQNLAAEHPRVRPLPIGNDYQTMWEKPAERWSLTRTTPLAQERLLLDALRDGPEFRRRMPFAYCNWHFDLNRGDRRDCRNRIDASLCFFEPHRVPRSASWRRQAEFMFAVSPEGVGIDCHRTWETLMLGAVPIIKRGVLSRLFVDLPVVEVDDWAEVTRARLQEWAAEQRSREFDFGSLFLAHWQGLIHGKRSTSLRATLPGFRQMLMQSGA